jgi:predicted anti-sigma-YlaC factor YlaD
VSIPLCRNDAAYLLGALSPSDHREFETHLAGCAACQRSVQQLAGLPGLLGKVQPADFSSPAEPPPPSLLPALTAAVRAERTRRRWRAGALAVAAAFTLVLLAFGVRAAFFSSSPPVGVAMSSVRETPVEATAQLTDKPWGTQIQLLCHYETSPSYGPQPRMYTLVVTDRAGTTQQVATWRVVPTGLSKVTASTGWRRADISRLEIRAPDGTPVLRLDT